jgi:D-lactate dehydrogenase (cytochrome)
VLHNISIQVIQKIAGNICIFSFNFKIASFRIFNLKKQQFFATLSALVASTSTTTFFLSTSSTLATKNSSYDYKPDKLTSSNKSKTLLSKTDYLITSLRNHLGSDAVESELIERENYGRDLHSFHSGDPPDLIVFPKTEEDIQFIMNECRKYSVPIVARAGGTSLEGHTTTPNRECVIDVSKMDRILSLNLEDMDVTVEPGVSWLELNKYLAPYNLFFPMDPGPGAMIGGMVATNCSGTNATRYGAMKNNVLSLRVVLADGSLFKTGNRARKTSAGYDLTSLIVGSEGTLGIVTSATLKLSPIPESTAVATSSFPSVKDASAAASEIMRSGTVVAALELLDGKMVDVVNEQSKLDHPANLPLLLVKLSGSKTKVNDDAQTVEKVALKHQGTAFKYAVDEQGKEKLWQARKVALWSAAGAHPLSKIATTDVCVPISKLPSLLADFEAEAKKSTLHVYAVAHAGDGNAHHFIVFNPELKEEEQEAKRLNSFLVKAAIKLDGTCTGEHGCGIGKLGYLEEELGNENLAVMRKIKGTLDPMDLLNRGKKVPKIKDNSFKSLDNESLNIRAPGCMV